MIEAKVIEDSINEVGIRISTLQIKFHRFILPEFNTHRVFSRNFSSSRAIPTSKLIDQVSKDPAIPVYWGKNESGMQAHEELVGYDKDIVIAQWRLAADAAVEQAELLHSMGLHKQIVNRVIEPFMWATGIVTSTEWNNWFALRAHEDAQPEIHELAIRMQEALQSSTPKLLVPGEWHLPYISADERNDQFFKIEANRNMLQKISAARCCRVSYLKHDGTAANINDDLALFQRLAGAEPIHASPLEHQATPDIYDCTDLGSTAVYAHLQGNFKGWVQYRKLWESTLK